MSEKHSYLEFIYPIYFYHNHIFLCVSRILIHCGQQVCNNCEKANFQILIHPDDLKKIWAAAIESNFFSFERFSGLVPN